MTENEAKTLAASTLDALAGPLAQELARADDFGKQIVLHISPRAGGVRIQLPPRTVKVGAPGAPTDE
jgi:hypothetical protein